MFPYPSNQQKMDSYLRKVATYLHDALKGASVISSDSLEPGKVHISLDLLEKLAGCELSDEEKKKISAGPTHCGYLFRMSMYCDKDLPHSSIMINSWYSEVIKKYTGE